MAVYIEPIPEDQETIAKRDAFYSEMLDKALQAGGGGTMGKPCNHSNNEFSYIYTRLCAGTREVNP